MLDMPYPPESKTIYEILKRMRYQEKPYIDEYTPSSGPNKGDAHYHLTLDGWFSYSAYRELELSGKVDELIKGIEDY